MLIYDIEIKKAIAGKNEEVLPDIDYCEGWHDHENMGISCVCAYDYKQDRYRTFFGDNMDIFMSLIVEQRSLIIGFNNIGFDNKVISKTTGYDLSRLNNKSYDILREVWISKGYDPDKFFWKTHGGYGLDDIAKANLPGGIGKTGHGAIAPIDYQKGRWGSLVDYCLADVWLTKKVFDLIMQFGQLLCPKTNEVMKIRKPCL